MNIMTSNEYLRSNGRSCTEQASEQHPLRLLIFGLNGASRNICTPHFYRSGFLKLRFCEIVHIFGQLHSRKRASNGAFTIQAIFCSFHMAFSKIIFYNFRHECEADLFSRSKCPWKKRKLYPHFKSVYYFDGDAADGAHRYACVCTNECFEKNRHSRKNKKNGWICSGFYFFFNRQHEVLACVFVFMMYGAVYPKHAHTFHFNIFFCCCFFFLLGALSRYFFTYTLCAM